MIKPPSFNNFLHALTYGAQLKPARDWLIVVSIALAILILSIIWNIVNFRGTIANDKVSVITHVSAPAINQSAIQNVQQLFSVRASEQTKYESGSYSFTDPSK